MPEPSFEEKYYEVLTGYLASTDEKYLLQAADLGRELVETFTPPEEVAEIHEKALGRLAQGSPQLRLGDVAQCVSAPFMEMSVAYGLAFRERLEARERAEEKLRQLNAELEQRVIGRTAELEAANKELEREVTERGRAEKAARQLANETRLLYAAAAVAAQTESFDDALQQCVDIVCEYVDWPIGHLYVPTADEGVLAPTSVWHLNDPQRFQAFRDVTERTRFKPGEGLPGRVFSSGEPAWIANVQEDDNFPRARMAEDIGVRGAFGFPVKIGTETVAVLEFFTDKAMKADPHILSVMQMVGSQIGRVLDRERSRAALVQQAERKQAEEALRRNEERFRSLSENAPIGIYLVQNGVFTFVNALFEQTTGYSKEELLGMHPLDLVEPEDVNTVRDNAVQMLKGERTGQYEYRFRRKDGEVRWAAESVSSSEDPGGRACYGHFMDITERKTAQDALRQSEERYRSLVDNASDAIVVAQEGKAVFQNPVYKKLLRYTATEIADLSFAEVVAPEDRERVGRYYERLMNGEAVPDGFEVRLVTGDGQTLMMEAKARVIEYDGQPAMMVIMRDVTERAAAQAALVQASRLASIGEMAAGVAHELNNPLTSVLGYADLLESVELPDQAKADLGKIRDNARRASTVVKKLLEFARPKMIGRSSVDIAEIVNKMIDLRAHEFTVSSVVVALDLGETLPMVIGDSGQIEQVILNLIVNAEQSMVAAHGKGKLTVQVRQQNRTLEIIVSDDGPGIPPDKIDRIFDPFFTTKAPGVGTGLGLSICHSIMTEHGGRIYARNNPDGGATFVLELPIQTGNTC